MKLSRNIVKLSCFLILFVLILADAWFFLNRDNNFAIFPPKPYSFFYGTRPGIKALAYRDGVLRGTIDPVGHKIRLASEPGDRWEGNRFEIPLTANRTIQFRDENDATYNLTVEFNYLPLKSPKKKAATPGKGMIVQVLATDFSPDAPGPDTGSGSLATAPHPCLKHG